MGFVPPMIVVKWQNKFPERYLCTKHRKLTNSPPVFGTKIPQLTLPPPNPFIIEYSPPPTPWENSPKPNFWKENIIYIMSLLIHGVFTMFSLHYTYMYLFIRLVQYKLFFFALNVNCSKILNSLIRFLLLLGIIIEKQLFNIHV